MLRQNKTKDRHVPVLTAIVMAFVGLMFMTSTASAIAVNQLIDPTPDPIATWCGPNASGAVFNAPVVGVNTIGPISITIDAGPPTSVSDVSSNSIAIYPTKIVVKGADTGGPNNDGYIEYTSPFTTPSWFAPAPTGQRLNTDVSQVIVCYDTNLTPLDLNDDTNQPDDNQDDPVDNTNDDDTPEVLGTTTDNDDEGGQVLGATETLAETGVPAGVVVLAGLVTIGAAITLQKQTSEVA